MCMKEKRRVVNNQLLWYLNHLPDKKLTKEEEQDLLKKCHQGDAAAKSELIYYNLRLVVSIAKKYAVNYETLLEYIQAGSIGVVEAIDHFDLEKGSKFSTYATSWISHQILNSLQNNCYSIKFSRRVFTQIYRCVSIKERLENTLGRVPTNEEIAEEMNASPRLIQEWLELYGTQNISSLDDVLPDMNHPVYAVVKEKEKGISQTHIDSVILRDMLLHLIHRLKLSVKQEKVILSLYGLEDGIIRTPDEVAEIFGNTRQNIDKINMSVLKKLREKIKVENFTGYLEHSEQMMKEKLLCIKFLEEERVQKSSHLYVYYLKYAREDFEAVLQSLPQEMKENLYLTYNDRWERGTEKGKLSEQEKEIRGRVMLEIEKRLEASKILTDQRKIK